MKRFRCVETIHGNQLMYFRITIPRNDVLKKKLAVNPCVQYIPVCSSLF